MRREATAALLEFAASDRPALLSDVLYYLAFSNLPASGTVLELAEILRASSIPVLSKELLELASKLDDLEKRGGRWQHPREVVGTVNVPGLMVFARMRAARCKGTTSRRRAKRLQERLEGAYRSEQVARRVRAFVENEQPKPDPVADIVLSFMVE